MRVLVALASLLVAVVIQVSVLNGLLLPGGGVPDLVLVLVCALAVTSGPANGMLIGFAAGLCLDLAPPDSGLVGQFALVFCLAGWAAGRLGQVAGQGARRSAWLAATGALVLAVAAGEVLSVAVTKVLTPASVSLRQQVGLVLPSAVAYDLVLCPVVLALVMLASTLLARLSPTVGLTRVLPGTSRSRRAQKRAGQLPELHLARNARSAARPAAAPRRRPGTRLRPAAGVPGSAAGLRYERTRPPRPVRLRLAGGRRGDGALGAGLTGTRPRGPGPGRHPGSLARGGPTFRPRPARPAGPAHGQVRRPPAISFAGHRGDGWIGQAPGPTGSAPRQQRTPVIHFGADAAGSSGPQLRMGARRTTATATVPRLTFAASHVPVQRRAPAEPRFGRGAAGRKSAAVVPGGVLGESALRARRQQAAPRLRLSRVRPGMLGGTGRSLLAGPPGRARKQPRFSYGKRSPLSLVTRSRVGRRFGGRWLARQRAGSRSGVWLLGRRAGGLR